MASDLSKFFKDRQVIILLLFLLISIGSIAFLGVEQGLDLKGGSSIQLQLEHPVNESTMKVVTSVLDKRLKLYGVSDVKVRSLTSYFSNFFTMMVALWPPKPKELLSAARTGRS